MKRFSLAREGFPLVSVLNFIEQRLARLYYHLAAFFKNLFP